MTHSTEPNPARQPVHPHDKVRFAIEWMLLAGLTCLYFAWFAAPLLGEAADNIRMVGVFNADEAMHARMIRDCLSEHTLLIDFGNYGHLYFNLVLIPLLVLSFFQPVSETTIIVALRVVPVIFSVGTVLITFHLARRYFDGLTAWLAALGLLIVPVNFLEISVVSHPDTPQLFFIMVSLYGCIRFADEQRFHWMIFASVAAGLAFACKYGGIFVLPVIWLLTLIIIWQQPGVANDGRARHGLRFIRIALIIAGIIGLLAAAIVTPELAVRFFSSDGKIEHDWERQLVNMARLLALTGGIILLVLAALRPLWRKMDQSPRLTTSILKLTQSLVAFGAAFLIASPFSLYKLNFFKGMYYESLHTTFGHNFATDRSAWHWLADLTHPNVLGPWLPVLVVVSLVFLLWHLYRDRWQTLLTPSGVLWIYSAIYLLYLVARVNMDSLHYLLPVVPALMVLAFAQIPQISQKFESKEGHSLAPLVQLALVFMVVGVVFLPGARDVLAFRQYWSQRVENSASVWAGKWLAEQYSPTTRILYDHICYVPPQFTDVERVMVGTTDKLQEFAPDVVVIHRRVYEKYLDPSRADAFFTGPEDFMRRHDYYQLIMDDNGPFHLVQDFGELKVYERK